MVLNSKKQLKLITNSDLSKNSVELGMGDVVFLMHSVDMLYNNVRNMIKVSELQERIKVNLDKYIKEKHWNIKCNVMNENNPQKGEVGKMHSEKCHDPKSQNDFLLPDKCYFADIESIDNRNPYLEECIEMIKFRLFNYINTLNKVVSLFDNITVKYILNPSLILTEKLKFTKYTNIDKGVVNRCINGSYLDKTAEVLRKYLFDYGNFGCLHANEGSNQHLVDKIEKEEYIFRCNDLIESMDEHTTDAMMCIGGSVNIKEL